MSEPDPLEAIKATFFQECDELLADLESGLLALESGESDAETINAIFRAVHSVKGGAGAFALGSLVNFAHVFETTLDDLRSGRIQQEPALLRVLLRATDVLADHVAAARSGAVADEAQSAELARALKAASAGEFGGDEPEAAPAGGEAETDPFGFRPIAFVFEQLATKGWRVQFAPASAMYAKANDAVHLLRELDRLGPCTVVVDDARLPSLDDLDPEDAVLSWIVDLAADVPEESVREIFEFVEGDCALEVMPLAAPQESTPTEETVDIQALLAAARTEAQASPDAAPPPVASRTEESPRGSSGAAPATIRVDLERVDRLIDLVGELVINQAMLAQRVGDSVATQNAEVSLGLAELEQLTREIQDSVMAIRAQPVRSVFQRMPRLVREAAALTNKQVRLVMEGENAEVDKTVIERLTDPITHMLRNAVDHGLESTEKRVAAGKSPEGLIKLSAQHRSGRVIIEVSDDGGGINRTKVREIAVARGLIAADAVLTDDEVDNLIFLPGFSTASEVSNISGRGVGMDVVRRSIQALGGRISIASQPGKGSTFTLSLPLTLAVLDGMVVTVAGQTFVAPLTAIVETLQPKRVEVHRVGPTGLVLAVRGSYVPLIDVGECLGLRAGAIDPARAVAILVETEGGGRAALLVDDIQAHGRSSSRAWRRTISAWTASPPPRSSATAASP